MNNLKTPTSELLPCPFCGSSDVELSGFDSSCYVQCATCLCQGPEQVEEDVAIDDWNHRASPWQPIETAPKDGTRLLLYGRWFDYMGQVSDNVRSYTGCSGYEIGSYDTMMGFWRVAKEYPCFEPSHWMPLPEQPNK